MLLSGNLLTCPRGSTDLTIASAGGDHAGKRFHFDLICARCSPRDPVLDLPDGVAHRLEVWQADDCVHVTWKRNG